MKLTFFILLSLVLGPLSDLAEAQNGTATVPTITDILTPEVNPPNEVLFALFPLAVTVLQTPIAIRYSLIIAASAYEVQAACHPVALSFFATKDAIPPKFCTSDNISVLSAYITVRVMQSQFPLDAVTYGTFLVKVGLNPFSKSTDKGTLEGWANVMATRLVTYFENDGWNSLGEVTRKHYRQPYEDSTGYSPENPADLAPGKLRRPLRWQPLRFQADQRGHFAYQQHVVPHIGRKVKPLTMSKRQYTGRRVDAPYRTPNRQQGFSSSDKKKMQQLINKLFATSASLTKQQVALATFWENKFFSLASFVGYYSDVLPIRDPFVRTRLAFGDMLAKHDAVLLAWKEKVRHDLVRPPTMIRRLLKGKSVKAFKSLQEGVGIVKASEWEPVVAIQPHSEFPSASAVICTASLEHLQLLLDEIVGKNGTIPAYQVTFGPGTLPLNPVQEAVTFRFNTLQEAARSCGMSRLWAGVHFEPSVPAGFKLGTGTGELAYSHVKDLFEGRVPKNCVRCIKK